MEILIIGCGAAGAAAAIAAAEAGHRVTVIDRNRKPLKKLGVTGNGRGNLMNNGPWRYYGDATFAHAVLEAMPPKAVADFLVDCGITLVEEDEGRVYPAANLASVAVDGLVRRMERLGVEMLPCALAERIQPEKNGFSVCIDPGHQGSWVDMSEVEPNAPGSSSYKAKATTGTQGQFSGVPEYELNLQIWEQLLQGVAMDAETAELLLAQLASARTEDAITQGFWAFSKMLPAYAVTVCSILAFAAQVLLNSFYATAGLQCVLDRNARIFTVSLSASVLYALSFVLMLFLPEDALATAVVQNLCLILLPGLCVLGTIRLLAILANLRGGSKIGLLVVVVLMLLLAAESAPLVLAMWGAYSNVANAIQFYLLKKMLEHENDRDKKDD
jgi:hypothetical protein